MAPFGETVLAWRLARKLTQVQLSSLTGVSRPNLSAMERGDREVTLMTLRRLALALGIRPGVLADGILPGQSAEQPSSRDSMERVAAAALANAGQLSARESELARRLRHVTATRFSTQARGPANISQRESARSLLLLRGLAQRETLTSLLDRMRDHHTRKPRDRIRRSPSGDPA